LVAHDSGSKIPDYQLAIMLNAINCKTLIVILDMSYAGGFIRDMNNVWWCDVAWDARGKPADNRIVLASCGEVKSPDLSDDTYSLIGNYGLIEMAFTHFLIKGFSYDKNNDGKTSIEEAFDYAQRQFPRVEFFGLRRLNQSPKIYDGFLTSADNSAEYILGDVIKTQHQSVPTTIFLVKCPVRLHVYDSAGKHVGIDKSGQLETGFQAYFQSINDSELVVIPNPSGTYTVKLVGTNEGSYNLTRIRLEDGLVVMSDSLTGNISRGQEVEYKFVECRQDQGIFGIPWLAWTIVGVITIVIIIFVIAVSVSRKCKQKRKISDSKNNLYPKTFFVIHKLLEQQGLPLLLLVSSQ
ncbi:MAG: hypothetical protein QXX08_09500, partial [Candidatus Bathyarchaeia archaeon]